MQDVLGNILNEVQQYVFELGERDKLAQLIDEFSKAIVNVRIDGEFTSEKQIVDTSTFKDILDASSKLGPNIEINIKTALEKILESQKTLKTVEKGVQTHSIHFGEINTIIKGILKELQGKHLWILLDEWVKIPKDIQPLIADFIGRALFPLDNAFTKIAAVEYDSVFNIRDSRGNKVGIKVGVHATPSLMLDEFLIFNYNSDESNKFFKSLILQHINNEIDKMIEWIDNQEGNIAVFG